MMIFIHQCSNQMMIPKTFQYKKFIKSLIDFCNQNDVTLLRTVGVMFADTEKRVSDYVN